MRSLFSRIYSFRNLPVFLLLPHVVKVAFEVPGLKTSVMNEEWGIEFSQWPLACSEPVLAEDVGYYSSLLDWAAHLPTQPPQIPFGCRLHITTAAWENLKFPTRALLRATWQDRDTTYPPVFGVGYMLFITKCTGKS